MRAPRALLSGVLSLFLAVGFVALTPAGPARGQLGAVRADKDGWWNRAKGGGLPITSPAIPTNTIPATGLAISASNGETEKAATVGIKLDADPERFQRLLLNVGEVADPGANIGAPVAVIKACPIKTAWVGAKDATWPPPSLPSDSELANCALGARSTEGIWSFDLTTFARQWLDGTLAQNGVLLIEAVDRPVSFQVVVGDRTTSQLTFAVDILSEDETSGGSDDSYYPPIESSSDTSDTGSTGSSDESPAVTTYEYSAADSFTVPVEQSANTLPAVKPAPAPTRSANSGTGTLADQRTPSLSGGLPWALILLLPIGLGVAFLLARALGPAGEPAVTTLARQGPVSRALARREDLKEGSR